MRRRQGRIRGTTRPALRRRRAGVTETPATVDRLRPVVRRIRVLRRHATPTVLALRMRVSTACEGHWNRLLHVGVVLRNRVRYGIIVSKILVPDELMLPVQRAFRVRRGGRARSQRRGYVIDHGSVGPAPIRSAVIRAAVRPFFVLAVITVHQVAASVGFPVPVPGYLDTARLIKVVLRQVRGPGRGRKIGPIASAGGEPGARVPVGAVTAIRVRAGRFADDLAVYVAKAGRQILPNCQSSERHGLRVFIFSYFTMLGTVFQRFSGFVRVNSGFFGQIRPKSSILVKWSKGQGEARIS